MQQHAENENDAWFESGTPAQNDSDDDLRPVRSETRQLPRKRDDGEDLPKPPKPDDAVMRNVFRSCLDLMSYVKADRKKANDRIAAALSDMDSQGIPREVTKLVARIQQWDTPKREAFDLAYRSARAYADMPIQPDMFMD